MNNDDDYQLQSYQDDLTTDDNYTDPLMDEMGDDPVTELGVPADEFKNELDKTLADDDDIDDEDDEIDVHDDEREFIEDLDQEADDQTDGR